MPGQKIAEIRNRLGEFRSQTIRPKLPMHHGRLVRPNLPMSVSITKIIKDPKKPDSENSDSNNTSKMDVDSDGETQVLDSEDEEVNKQFNSKRRPEDMSKANNIPEQPNANNIGTVNRVDNEVKPDPGPIVLTTDEKLPSEEALEKKTFEVNVSENSSLKDISKSDIPDHSRGLDHVERKINLLKNYRHQRPGARPLTESSLSQLEKTASVLNKEGMPDFRKNLDDITQSYSPNGEEKPVTKSKKKKSPNKTEVNNESQGNERPMLGMSHSVSSLLGSSNSHKKGRKTDISTLNTVPVAPLENSDLHPSLISRSGASVMANDLSISQVPGLVPKCQPALPLNMSHSSMLSAGPQQSVGVDMSKSSMQSSPHPPSPLPTNPMTSPGQPYQAGNIPPDSPYGQYPGKKTLNIHFGKFDSIFVMN